MKVLLIEPRNCWRGLNIALAYLAGALRQNGIEVKVLDLANHRDWPVNEMVEKAIAAFRPDLVGIALFYISYWPVKEMIAHIKGFCRVPIVVGGPQMMIEQERILEDIPELDFALVGDGEEAIVELCSALQGLIPLSEIDGLIYRDNGKVMRNKDRVLRPDIDNRPFPDYKSFGITRMKRYSIITSRGCPYTCAYCFRSTKKWRPRSPQNIIAEIEHAISEYKIEEFSIVDDAFNILPQRVLEFCDLLEQHGITLPWYCTGVRPDKMTDALAKRMKETGCYLVAIGVETLQPDVYANLQRNVTIDQIKECIAILKRHRIRCVGYYMIGLPGDTQAKTLDTFKKMKGLGIDDTSGAIFLPFPGTKLHDFTYSQPGVKRLQDYKTISTIWTYDPEYCRMKTAFETPEYTAKQKIEMYNRLRTKEGDPRPPYYGNLFILSLYCMSWVIKYDFFRSPVTLYRLARSFLSRFINAGGRHVYRFDIHYDPDLLKIFHESN